MLVIHKPIGYLIEMISSDHRKGSNTTSFVVKTAGGAASQCLALMSAIYISRKIGRPFVIRHYPYSTGGYYPLAIEALLKKDELDSMLGKTRGLEIQKEFVVGAAIDEHPMFKIFSYEKLLGILRRLHLESPAMRLRGEWSLNGSRARLDKTPPNIRTVTGGYIPFIDSEVRNELASRFDDAGIPSMFGPSEDLNGEPSVVIHYRLGDKRLTYSYQLGAAHGIVNPTSFREILEKEGFLSDDSIYVISDEPLLAQALLKEVGINAKTNPTKGNLWSDLALMSKAKLLICPWSTVSQFAAACLVGDSRKVYYPDADGAGHEPPWHVEGLVTYTASYLPPSHAVYQEDFVPKPDAHQIYDHDSSHNPK